MTLDIQSMAWPTERLSEAVHVLAQASRYRALLEAERIVRKDMWADAKWRRLWLKDGELKERSPTDDSPENRD